MGRPLPGYRVQITDNDGHITKEGEVTLVLGAYRPAGLMQGYQGDDGKLSGADGDSIAPATSFPRRRRHLTFVGRADDVFKSSDYRISPFELESVLLEHERRGSRGGAESRSDPARDPQGLRAPGGGAAPSPRHRAVDLPPPADARAVQADPPPGIVTELPKTISGKIRRVQLRFFEHDNDRAEIHCAARNFAKKTTSRAGEVATSRVDGGWTNERSMEEASDTLDAYQKLVGREVGVSSWHLVDQAPDQPLCGCD